MRESAWYPTQHARTKDGPKARADLKSMGIREELHANDDDDDDDDDDGEAKMEITSTR